MDNLLKSHINNYNPLPCILRARAGPLQLHPSPVGAYAFRRRNPVVNEYGASAPVPIVILRAPRRTMPSHFKGGRLPNDLVSAKHRIAKLRVRTVLIQSESRQYDAAISDLNIFLAKHPEYSFGYNLRGSAYYLSERFKEAKQDFSKCLEIESDGCRSWLGLTNEKLDMEKKENASRSGWQ